MQKSKPQVTEVQKIETRQLEMGQPCDFFKLFPRKL